MKQTLLLAACSALLLGCFTASAHPCCIGFSNNGANCSTVVLAVPLDVRCAGHGCAWDSSCAADQSDTDQPTGTSPSASPNNDLTSVQVTPSPPAPCDPDAFDVVVSGIESALAGQATACPCGTVCPLSSETWQALFQFDECDQFAAQILQLYNELLSTSDGRTCAPTGQPVATTAPCDTDQHAMDSASLLQQIQSHPCGPLSENLQAMLDAHVSNWIDCFPSEVADVNKIVEAHTRPCPTTPSATGSNDDDLPCDGHVFDRLVSQVQAAIDECHCGVICPLSADLWAALFEFADCDDAYFLEAIAALQQQLSATGPCPTSAVVATPLPTGADDPCDDEQHASDLADLNKYLEAHPCGPLSANVQALLDAYLANWADCFPNEVTNIKEIVLAVTRPCPSTASPSFPVDCCTGGEGNDCTQYNADQESCESFQGGLYCTWTAEADLCPRSSPLPTADVPQPTGPCDGTAFDRVVAQIQAAIDECSCGTICPLSQDLWAALFAFADCDHSYFTQAIAHLQHQVSSAADPCPSSTTMATAQPCDADQHASDLADLNKYLEAHPCGPLSANVQALLDAYLANWADCFPNEVANMKKIVLAKIRPCPTTGAPCDADQHKADYSNLLTQLEAHPCGPLGLQIQAMYDTYVSNWNDCFPTNVANMKKIVLAKIRPCPCEAPTVANALPSQSSVMPGETLELCCVTDRSVVPPQDYTLDGQPRLASDNRTSECWSAKCDADSVLQGWQAQQCLPVKQCPREPSLPVANGQWLCLSNDGTVCQVVCDRGFALVGSAKAQCDVASGAWAWADSSQDPAQCLRKEQNAPKGCRAAPDLGLIQSRNFGWSNDCSGSPEGSSCAWNCPAGYESQGSVQCVSGQWTGVDSPACVLPACGDLPQPPAKAAVSLADPKACQAALPAAHGHQCQAQCDDADAVMSRLSFVCLFGRWQWPVCRTITQIKEEVVAVQAAVLNVTALRQQNSVGTKDPAVTEAPRDADQKPLPVYAIRFKSNGAAKQMQTSLKSAWDSMAQIRIPSPSDITNASTAAAVQQQRQQFIGQVYSLLDEQTAFADAADPDGAISASSACESWSAMQRAIGLVFDSSMPAAKVDDVCNGVDDDCNLTMIGNPKPGGPSFMAAKLVVGQAARLRRGSSEYFLRTVSNPVAGATTVGLSIASDFSSALGACAASYTPQGRRRRLLADNDEALVAMSSMETVQLRHDGAVATIGDFAGQPNEFDIAINFARLSTSAAATIRNNVKEVAGGTACGSQASSLALPVCHAVQENDPTTTADNVWDSSVCQTSFDAANTDRVRCSCSRYSSVMVFAGTASAQDSWCTNTNADGTADDDDNMTVIIVAVIAAIVVVVGGLGGFIFVRRRKSAGLASKLDDREGLARRAQFHVNSAGTRSLSTAGVELSMVTTSPDSIDIAVVPNAKSKSDRRKHGHDMLE